MSFIQRRLSVWLALGVALSVVLSACSKPAPPKDPYVGLVAHMRAMIKILQDNEADPEKADRELTAYHQKYDAEIERLKAAAAEVLQKDPMKAAAASAAYGMASAEVDGRTHEMKSRVKPK